MAHEVKIGMTDYSVTVFIPDPASTDGSGKTGLVAANLTVSGVRVETDNDVTVTDYTASLNDLAALTTAHTDWGLKEVSSTLAPGLYRLDIADAVFAAGAWSAVVYVMITSSAAAAVPTEFIMVPQSPIDGVDVKSVGGTAQTAGDIVALINTVDDLLDTEIAAIKTVVDAIQAKTDNLPTDPADQSALEALIDALPTANEVRDAVFANVTDGTYTFAEVIRIMAAMLAGEISGADEDASGTASIRSIDDSKVRLTITFDDQGNRTGVTINNVTI